MILFTVLSRLLDYPDAELWQHRQELLQGVRESSWLTAEQQQGLSQFIEDYLNLELLDAQEAYCQQFDHGRATSLLLFEHVYGDSRQRGSAMVELLEHYQQAGLSISAKQLPDYLPLYLEYLAQLKAADIAANLGNIAVIVQKMTHQLQQRQSLYWPLLLALQQAIPPQYQVPPSEEILQDIPDDSRVTLDALWQEEPVTFMSQTPSYAKEYYQAQRIPIKNLDDVTHSARGTDQ